MRMWIGVQPNELCMGHLSGEHFEIHKHRHNFVKGHSMDGRIEGNALEPGALQWRHDALEAELRRRAVEAGRKPPSSPFVAPDISYLPQWQQDYKIDRYKNRELLRSRCAECAERMAVCDRIAA